MSLNSNLWFCAKPGMLKLVTPFLLYSAVQVLTAPNGGVVQNGDAAVSGPPTKVKACIAASHVAGAAAAASPPKGGQLPNGGHPRGHQRQSSPFANVGVGGGGGVDDGFTQVEGRNKRGKGRGCGSFNMRDMGNHLPLTRQRGRFLCSVGCAAYECVERKN